MNADMCACSPLIENNCKEKTKWWWQARATSVYKKRMNESQKLLFKHTSNMTMCVLMDVPH